MSLLQNERRPSACCIPGEFWRFCICHSSNRPPRLLRPSPCGPRHLSSPPRIRARPWRHRRCPSPPP
jgi:hypothetical protein